MSTGVILRRGDTASTAIMVKLRGYADCGFACHVSMSICEGEIGAAVELTGDTIFIKDILREPYQEQMKPTPVYDDAAAITWRPAWTAITNMSAACVPRSTG